MFEPGEILRVGLESALAMQFALLAAYLLIVRNEAGARVAVGALSMVLAATMLLNLAATVGFGGAIVEYSTAPLEAAAPPLLLFTIITLAALPMGVVRWIGALPPLAVAALVGTGQFRLIGPVSIGSAILFFGLCVWRNSRANYASSQAAAFARLLIVWFAAFLVLRIMLEAQAPKLGPVRGSSIYLLVLFGLVLLSTRILFLCLSSPNVLIAVPPKYQSSPLSDPDLDALELRIRDLLETRKIYRKPDLKLAEVARLVGAVDREISQVVNSRFGTNFAALVNRLRVEEAAERLASSGSTAITTILFDVGFGSKSAFQREFSRRFEISPSEYRRRARREPGRTPNTLAG